MELVVLNTQNIKVDVLMIIRDICVILIHVGLKSQNQESAGKKQMKQQLEVPYQLQLSFQKRLTSTTVI